MQTPRPAEEPETADSLQQSSGPSPWSSIAERIIKACLPRTTTESSDSVRDRLFVVAMLWIILIQLIIMLTVPRFRFDPFLLQIVFPYNGIDVLFLLVLTLWMFRVSGRRGLCGHILLAALAVISLAPASLVGGPGAPMVTLLMVLAPLAAVLVGGTACMIWSLVAVISWFALGLQRQPWLADEPVAAALVHTISLVVILAVVASYVHIVERLCARLRQQNDHLQYLADHDPLTGLTNRRGFFMAAHRAAKRSLRSGRSFTLLILDLTQFKLINDTLGHLTGDEVLRQFARRLRDGLRETDLVARLGGDEFAVMLDLVGDEESLEHVMTKSLEELKLPMAISGRQVAVCAAIGAAMFPRDGKTIAEVFECADGAMYYSKRHDTGYTLFGEGIEPAKVEIRSPNVASWHGAPT